MQVFGTQVVGLSRDASGKLRAALWALDLPSLGFGDLIDLVIQGMLTETEAETLTELAGQAIELVQSIFPNFYSCSLSFDIFVESGR